MATLTETTAATVFIYALRDPRDGSVRYVGKTDNLERRVRHHIGTRREKNARGAWLRELHAVGLAPVAVVLQEVPQERWQHAERRWIRRLAKRVSRLLNAHPGGGGAGCVPEDKITPDPKAIARIVKHFASGPGNRHMRYRLFHKSALGGPLEIDRMDVVRMIRRDFGRFGSHDKAICTAVYEQLAPVAREIAKDIA